MECLSYAFGIRVGIKSQAPHDSGNDVEGIPRGSNVGGLDGGVGGYTLNSNLNSTDLGNRALHACNDFLEFLSGGLHVRLRCSTVVEHLDDGREIGLHPQKEGVLVISRNTGQFPARLGHILGAHRDAFQVPLHVLDRRSKNSGRPGQLRGLQSQNDASVRG